MIATGGGAVIRECNRMLLLSFGLVVWLKADPQELARRLAGRPASLGPAAADARRCHQGDRQRDGGPQGALSRDCRCRGRYVRPHVPKKLPKRSWTVRAGNTGSKSCKDTST